MSSPAARSALQWANVEHVRPSDVTLWIWAPTSGRVGAVRGFGCERDRDGAVVHRAPYSVCSSFGAAATMRSVISAITRGAHDAQPVGLGRVVREELRGEVGPRQPVEADDLRHRVAGGGELGEQVDALGERHQDEDVGVGGHDGLDLLGELDATRRVLDRVDRRATRRQLRRQVACELDAVHVVAPEDDDVLRRLDVLLVAVDVHDLVGDDDRRVVVAIAVRKNDAAVPS